MDADEARQELYAVMSADLDFEAKAERALAIGAQYLAVDNGHVAKIDPDSNYWEVIASTDPDDGPFRNGRILEFQTTYCRRTAGGEGPIALHDAPAQGWADDPAFETHGLHCYHGTTIRLGDEPYGTVCFVAADPRPVPFTDAETMFAELVAHMLEHELQRQHTEAQLDRLQQFASVLAHDLRNPLMAASGRLEAARSNDDNGDLAAVAESLDRIETLIEDLLTMAREGSRVTETEAVSLAIISDACWEMVATEAASLTIVDDLTVQADRSQFRQLLENLFRNAVEHGGADVSIRVGALADRAGFYVEDDGPGIPEEVRQDIFGLGYSTGNGGLGIGLSIVQGVVTAHDWDITVTESTASGARFEIRAVTIEPAAD